MFNLEPDGGEVTVDPVWSEVVPVPLDDESVDPVPSVVVSELAAMKL